MSKWQFTKGLHDLGNGAYAYLQPGGSWGWSNAGLVVDSGESLLVDTLFDGTQTLEMLSQMKTVAGMGAGDIGTLVNTHANPDHTFGNGYVTNATIIASEASAAEMSYDQKKISVERQHAVPHMNDNFGDFLRKNYAAFDFETAEMAMPDKTFSGAMSVNVGNKEVQLIEVGPAHTAGDVLIYVPEDKTIFTGDILFIDNTPILWAGPIRNWVKACDLMIEMDLDMIVPGHGPITDKKGVRDVKRYLNYIDQEARKRFEAGLSVIDAIHDIALHDFESWGDAERIAVNVDTLYREYSGDDSPRNIEQLFRLMADIAMK